MKLSNSKFLSILRNILKNVLVDYFLVHFTDIITTVNKFLVLHETTSFTVYSKIFRIRYHLFVWDL